jgi:hypothetical protein
MSTDAAEVTAETAQTETATTSNTSTEKEVTLDDVYRDAGLDKATQTETRTDTRTEPAKTEPPKIEPSSIPDAYDTENFKAWLARNAAGTQQLHEAVTRIAQHITQDQRERLMTVTKADIESAVSAIDETVQVGKPKLIEAYLDGEVRADPRMKALWENRAKHPAAWRNALGVVAKKMAKEFDLKVDPALAAAQRARKESQRTMATTHVDDSNPLEERMGKAQGADFDLEWERLKGSGF